MRKIDWQYWLICGFGKIVCLLPYAAVRKLGAVLGELACKLLKKQRTRALLQCSECLGIPETAADKIVRRMFANFGQMIMEVFWTPRAAKGKFPEICAVEGKGILDELVKMEGGAVVLTAHYGNWEWMAANAVQMGYPVSAIARFTDRGLDRFLNKMRELAGWKVFRKRGRDVALGAVKSLKSGDYLTFLMDGDAGGDQGVWTEFLGKQSSTHAGAAYFAAKYNCPVLPVFMRRTERGHTMKVYPLMRYEQPDMEKNSGIKAFVQQLNRVIEQEIREHPENWLWFQKRWNSKYEAGSKK